MGPHSVNAKPFDRGTAAIWGSSKLASGSCRVLYLRTPPGCFAQARCGNEPTRPSGLRKRALGGSLPFPIRCWRSALPSSSTVPGRPRDRRHQWRWPKMLCAISRPIPQPNPCTTDVIKPAPCSGAKTAIAPTAKPARTIILTTMLLEIEAEETDRRGQRERAVRRRNMFVAPSPAAAAARSPRRPR